LVNSLVVLQTTLVYCKLKRNVAEYLICELDLAACDGHVRTLQTLGKELRSVRKGLHIPMVEK
jgi:hypothetical protein